MTMIDKETASILNSTVPATSRPLSQTLSDLKLRWSPRSTTIISSSSFIAYLVPQTIQSWLAIESTFIPIGLVMSRFLWLSFWRRSYPRKSLWFRALAWQISPYHHEFCDHLTQVRQPFMIGRRSRGCPIIMFVMTSAFLRLTSYRAWIQVVDFYLCWTATFKCHCLDENFI